MTAALARSKCPDPAARGIHNQYQGALRRLVRPGDGVRLLDTCALRGPAGGPCRIRRGGRPPRARAGSPRRRRLAASAGGRAAHRRGAQRQLLAGGNRGRCPGPPAGCLDRACRRDRNCATRASSPASCNPSRTRPMSGESRRVSPPAIAWAPNCGCSTPSRPTPRS